MPKSRGLYVVAAACLGAGLGLLIYRFAVLGLAWDSSRSWLFATLAAGIAIGGQKLIQGRTDPPPMGLRVAAALGGAGLAMGAAFLVVPPLGHVRLTTRQLPGFSIDLPPGTVGAESITYEAGKVTLVNVGGTGSVVGVQWEPGRVAREDLLLAADAMAPALGGAARKHEAISLPGPGGAPVDSVVVDTDKGTLRLTFVPCGVRRLLVLAIGSSGMEAVHHRMVASIECTPDAAKESIRPGEVRVAVSLPGWYATERAPGVIMLTDGEALLVLRSGAPSSSGLAETFPALFAAVGGNLTAGPPDAAGTVSLTGELEGEHVEGWGRRLPCTGYDVTIVAFAADRARADELATLAGPARCLRDGESPPVWPDAPPDAPGP